MSQYDLQGSSLKTFPNPDQAICSTVIVYPAETTCVLQKFRTGILKTIQENIKSGADTDLLKNYSLKIYVDRKILMIMKGEGGPLIEICIVGNETPDEAVHYCSTNIANSAEETLILQKLRTGIFQIIKDKINSGADKDLLTNLNLNICVDRKITLCKIGKGGLLLIIRIVGNEMSYKWID